MKSVLNNRVYYNVKKSGVINVNIIRALYAIAETSEPSISSRKALKISMCGRNWIKKNGRTSTRDLKDFRNAGEKKNRA